MAGNLCNLVKDINIQKEETEWIDLLIQVLILLVLAAIGDFPLYHRHSVLLLQETLHPCYIFCLSRQSPYLGLAHRP